MGTAGVLTAMALMTAAPGPATPAGAREIAASPAPSPAPSPSVSAPVPATPAAPPPPSEPPAACDARAWRHLIGRTLGDVLTMRLPPGTQIYRVGDTPPARDLVRGRLAVEIARTSRVRRVHCG